MLLVYFSGGILLSGMNFIFPQRRSVKFFTFGFLVIQVLFVVYTFFHRGETELGYFSYDPLALIFLSVLALISSATFYHTINYTKDTTHIHRSFFYSSFIVLNMALAGVYMANNLIVTWILIELTTLTMAFLVNYNRTTNSLEATWKYIFICSVGIALAYIGILFAGAASGVAESGNLSYENLEKVFRITNPLYLKMAFILILVGYSSKLEIFPLYTIGIDANYVAPAPISAFLSTALVNGGFVAFFRIFQSISGTIISPWVNSVITITGIISVIVAAIYMQKATNLKRIFAYSTVEHMGLVMIALSLGKPGIYIALLQIIFHSFVKSGLFYQTGILHRVLKSYKLHKSGGYLKLNPAGAMILSFGVILITAFPPSGLFLSEFLLFRELGVNHILTFIIVALLLTLIVYGIFTKNTKILAGEPEYRQPEELKINNFEYVSQILFFLLVVVFCFHLPDFVNELISSVSGSGNEIFDSLFNL